MKTMVLILACCALLLANPAFADKPAWTGKGKPTSTQKQLHKEAMTTKNGKSKDQAKKYRDDDADDQVKGKYQRDDSDDRREQDQHQTMDQTSAQKSEQYRKKKLDQQETLREQKATQEQKELGKGAEEGQKARETRKKWWQFGQ